MIMDTVSVNLGQKNMLYSLKKIVIGHPYYSHFSKTAAFFCPKEAAVETVGLWITPLCLVRFFPSTWTKKKRKEI